jgi:large subunit GTPase 1
VDRRLWADYFDQQHVRYAFFSAANAAALQELRREMELAKAREAERETTGNEESSGSDDEDDPQTPEDETPEPQEDAQPFTLPVEEDSEDARDPRTRVLSVLELEDLFSKVAPDLTSMARESSVDQANIISASSLQGCCW